MCTHHMRSNHLMTPSIGLNMRLFLIRPKSLILASMSLTSSMAWLMYQKSANKIAWCNVLLILTTTTMNFWDRIRLTVLKLMGVAHSKQQNTIRTLENSLIDQWNLTRKLSTILERFMEICNTRLWLISMDVINLVQSKSPVIGWTLIGNMFLNATAKHQLNLTSHHLTCPLSMFHCCKLWNHKILKNLLLILMT